MIMIGLSKSGFLQMPTWSVNNVSGALQLHKLDETRAAESGRMCFMASESSLRASSDHVVMLT